MKHVGIEIKFYNLDTFKKQIDVNFIDLDSNSVDLNYKVTSLIFCHVWRSRHLLACTFQVHLLLHKKQGIFSDSADLAKLLYYSLPGPERKFRCLFYDQSWLINDFDHVNFLWHTKCRKLLSVILDYYRIFN